MRSYVWILFLFVLPCMTPAATITWINNGTFTDNSVLDLSSAGLPVYEVYGVGFNLPGPQTTENGYTFNDYTGGNMSVSGLNSYDNYLGGGGTSNAGFNAILNYGLYGIAVPATLNNLEVGQTYTVLVLLADTRNVQPIDMGFQVFDGGGYSPYQIFTNWSGGVTAIGGYALGYFKADATTQECTVHTLGAGTQYNAILLSAVDLADTPTPSDGAIDVELGTNFDWDAPSQYTPEGYKLYLRSGDPNFADTAGNLLNGVPATPPYDYAQDLDYDTTYYWRVDTLSDPNIHEGFVWQFSAKSSIPIVTSQPVDTQAFLGESTSFDMTVTSLSLEHYQWYKTEDPNTNTPADDIAVGSNASTYWIDSVTVEDEGYYYCEITNEGGSVISDMVKLGVKVTDPVAYWTLDSKDFVGGQYLDSSGYGRHVTPAGTEPSFVQGVDPSVTNEGLNISNNVQYTGIASESDNPSQYTREITVSAWIKSYGATGFNGILSRRTAWNNSDFAFYMSSNNDSLVLESANAVSSLIVEGGWPVGKWFHIVATIKNDSSHSGAIYIDGQLVKSGNGMILGTSNVLPWVVGSIEPGAYPFNGVMDEIKVYNYAMTQSEIIDNLYYPVSGQQICIKADFAGAAYDLVDDCVIDLKDFAEIARVWLSTGLYPLD